MEIYTLTDRGRILAHSRRNPPTPEWGVIHHLAKYGGVATKEQLLEYVPGVSTTTLIKLRLKRIITEQGAVSP